MSQTDHGENSSSAWKTVGKVKDAHSLKGELFILIFSGETAWIKKLKNFKLNSALYNVEKVKPHKNGLILKAAEIQDRTQAEALKGQAFSIPTDLLVSQKGEVIYLSEILQFQVYDRDQLLGPVESISSNGAQDLLVIQYAKKEIEIPFVAEFIEKIDYEKKIILMKLPSGLIEIQLGLDSEPESSDSES